MIAHLIEGMRMEGRVRDHIQKSSLELISFMEHIGVVMIELIFTHFLIYIYILRMSRESIAISIRCKSLMNWH